MSIKDDKSIIDEMWKASGLSADPQKEEEPAPQPAAEEPKKEEPAPAPIVEEPKAEEPPKPKKTKKEKEPKPEKPKKEPKEPKDTVEKKKDIKFLVLYTTVFVVVISGLIGGSYMITSRIHKQMAENNAEINLNHSTLTNIQSENDRLKKENAELKERNEQCEAIKKEADELVNAVSNMVEQDANLVAAQSAAIQGDKKLAEQLLSVIERDKLSEPNKAAYDILQEELK